MAQNILGEILTVLSCIGQKGANTVCGRGKEWSIVRLYVNEKEVPALVKSIEGFIAVNPQSVEAQELLNRILICIEKQCHSKTNS